MSKPYNHAKSSAKKFGGVWEDYIEIHELMDSSKAAIADNRHRVLTHNSWFISYILPKIFGETFKRESDNQVVSTRDVAEQHILEDYRMKFIPTPQDFIEHMEYTLWMQNGLGIPSSMKNLKFRSNKEREKILNLD